MAKKRNSEMECQFFDGDKHVIFQLPYNQFIRWRKLVKDLQNKGMQPSYIEYVDFALTSIKT